MTFLGQPKEFLATEHDLDPKLIDSDALYILSKLRQAGYTAYLVGGSVRDLLIKKRPKDFDISTSARPEEIKALFQRQCILIGKRFRLAHIRFGRKIFEVATFRAGANESDLITADNVWGSPEEDAMRRDFTINGLFYDAANHTIIDYVGGWDDIHKKHLRTIGDPNVRFKQDPVRMIRLVKFTARYGFEVDSISLQAMGECKEEILKSSPARILEELLRMLESGAAAPFFQLMTKHGLLDFLFPSLTNFLKSKHGKEIYRYLGCADKICEAYGPGSIERPVLIACLLYPILEREIKLQYLDKNKTPNLGNVILLSSALIKAAICSSFSHFPRRISANVNFILSSQYRLTPCTHKRHYSVKLVKNKEFIASLKFLKLRSLINPALSEEYNTWKKLYRQHQHHGERHPHPHHHHHKPISRGPE